MRRERPWVIALVLTGLTASSGFVLSAHHSIAAVYDSSKRVTIEGVVTRFQFTNPHPLLMINVAETGGGMREWRLEMDNRSELAAVGVTTETLKPGDRVVVTGSLARSQEHSLYIQKLERPSDGFQYEQVGSSPRVRTPAQR